MRRMLVIAYRAITVFVSMFRRFMSNAADLADVTDVIFVVGVFVAAYRARTVLVIVLTLLSAHDTLACFGIVIMRGNGVTTDSTDM